MSTTPILPNDPSSGDPQGISLALQDHIRTALQQCGGWMGFDEFMSLALYAPGLGYYANGSTKFGAMAESGSDFVTSPELTPLFGKALARQVAQALERTQTDEVWEFGAGTGALALQLLQTLGEKVRRYTIVDVSESLKVRQADTLRAYGDRVQWVSSLPQTFRGVVVGNEVLDAMPVKLLMRLQGHWHERGVVWQEKTAQGAGGAFAWSDRPTGLRPPLDIAGEHDYLTEIHSQGEAFARTLARSLHRGAVFLLDYGFPEREYYHVQRHMGTVMCHRAHRSDPDPLADVGLKDITAHVNFTGIALAAQDAGAEVLGYTNQAHFLINCGFAQDLLGVDRTHRVAAQKLIMEHEMGEFFKVLGWTTGPVWDALGFAQGDRTHRL